MKNRSMGTAQERLGRGLGDGNGLSWSGGYGKVVGEQEPTIADGDARILRELGGEVAEIAAQDEQARKRKLWTMHNSLRETRPLVFCDPENAWYEIIPADRLRCWGNLARVWEFRLRKELFWALSIKDDRVVEGCFPVHYVFNEGQRGIDTKLIGDNEGGSYRWDAPLIDYADLEKMRFRDIHVDRVKTGILLDLARGVFDGVLEVVLEGSWWWSLGMTTDLVLLRGMERMLLDMYDEAEGFHHLMAFLRDENLAKLEFLEGEGLLTLNNGGDFIGTGGYGWCSELPPPGFDARRIGPRDLWGFCESQETVGVSPGMFEEFIFPYQLAILERFGLNIYGCCEPLDTRRQVIEKIPRLRKVTVSPWSDVDLMAEFIGKDHVFCGKVNPSHVATDPMDEEAARAQLRRTFRASRANACPTEVLLRDIVTLSGKAEHAIRWTEMAREEAENAYG